MEKEQSNSERTLQAIDAYIFNLQLMRELVIKNAAEFNACGRNSGPCSSLPKLYCHGPYSIEPKKIAAALGGNWKRERNGEVFDYAGERVGGLPLGVHLFGTEPCGDEPLLLPKAKGAA